ncbi:unnamed protein product, partial [Symbiodinium sp. CCMP2456]
MAFLVLLGLLAVASAEEMNNALDTDNECFGDEACAFNALQVHGTQSFDEQLIEVDQSAADQFSVYWVNGNPGYNCDQVCATRQLKGQRMACDARAFGLTPDAAGIMKAAQSAGTRCAATWANNGAYGHTFDNVPAICMESKCGVDPHGLCAYSPKNAATCAGSVPKGYGRICPCNVATNSAPAPPAPQQPQYTLPSPGPHPSQYMPPAPAPHQPQYTPPTPPAPAPVKPAGKCITKTDVSCTMKSCSKKMGPTECKYKDGSWIHKRVVQGVSPLLGAMAAHLPEGLPPHTTTLVFHSSRKMLYSEFMAHLLSSCGSLLGLEMIDLVLCTSPQEVIVNFTSQDACTCTIDMMAADGNMLFAISVAQRQGLRSNLAYFFNQPIPHQRFAQAIHVFSGGREIPLRLAHARHLCFELQASGRDSDALHPTQLQESPDVLLQ